ncbi:MAG: hypothetical protein U1D99_09455, partial [Candidatus Omnitrophota bacterium]|nr:hypothetical protein [Candidatus Omnitrophota bacterium]
MGLKKIEKGATLRFPEKADGKADSASETAKSTSKGAAARIVGTLKKISDTAKVRTLPGKTLKLMEKASPVPITGALPKSKAELIDAAARGINVNPILNKGAEDAARSVRERYFEEHTREMVRKADE